MAALGLLMAEGSGLRVNGDKWEGAATAQMVCYGYAAASSRYARRDLRCAYTEHLRGVDVCLILDQFGERITCPIQEGDGANLHWRAGHVLSFHQGEARMFEESRSNFVTSSGNPL